jgi:O-antigen/teichoic acid export membrane protein
MNAPVGKLIVRGSIWTIGIYLVSVTVRFCSNVLLSRLITPEIFGAVVIISTLRSGIELVTDVGIGQNIVNSPNGDTSAFRNTAWTIQLARGVLLSSIFMVLSGVMSSLYAVPQDAIIITACTFALMGTASTSIFLMQRRLQFARLNLFDLSQDVIASLCVIVAALLSATLWSVLLAQIIATAVRTVSSYLLPDARNWPKLDWGHAVSILTWGRWIYLWSALSFLSVHIDRFFLGGSAPLATLGLYGLARSIADLPTALAGRLGHSLIFPLLASFGGSLREDLRDRIAKVRFLFLLITAACLAPAVAFGDVAMALIYDSRYAASGWMLPLLLIGAWGAILCLINEYSFLGVGKPLYGALGNAGKLAILAIAMPLGFQYLGFIGVILALIMAECGRYACLSVGQIKEHLVFFTHDLTATLAFATFVVALTQIRQAVGLGSAFAQLLTQTGG